MPDKAAVCFTISFSYCSCRVSAFVVPCFRRVRVVFFDSAGSGGCGINVCTPECMYAGICRTKLTDGSFITSVSAKFDYGLKCSVPGG